MKARPRHAENRIAEEITKITGELFEREPLIGLTGPDLTWPNPFGWAIDVKSRLEVPRHLWQYEPYRTATYAVVGLGHFGAGNLTVQEKESKIVIGYLAHMKEWTDIHGGIPIVVLHRPKMDYDKAVLVCYNSAYETVTRMERI